jgi:glycosyltransferase involved in cell wall biosynthesis
MQSKIKIAFIKFGGLSAGGTEKFLQVLAANLPKERFLVDYFYCDTAPYLNSDFKHLDTDLDRLEFMKSTPVNLIKFHVDHKDISTPYHDWVGTDFWEKFDESNYDLIQTGRGGYPEYPFIKIKKAPIIDSLHLSSHIDNQYNISRVLHISRWSADQWIKKGGDSKRVKVISTFIEIPKKDYQDLRTKLNIENKFVFGFHQRKDDWIYSPIPLAAYKKIENEDTVFVLLNGSDLYKKQAEDLDIKNIIFLPYAETQDDIYSFIKTLDVFSHGRKDGEVNSAAMAEAMYFGLPIVSHTSIMANGHIEAISDAGKVVETIEEYALELAALRDNKDYYNLRSTNAVKRFDEHYELQNQIKKIIAIYEEALRDPFPNSLRRTYFHLLTKSRILLYNKYTIKFYRKLKKLKSK